MTGNAVKIYNLFYQDSMGYRRYLSTYATRKKAEEARLRICKRYPFKKSSLLVRVGKVL